MNDDDGLEEVKRVSEETIEFSERIETYLGLHDNEQALKDIVKHLEEKVADDLRGLAIFVCTVFVVLSVLFFTAVFFGYKLYKSLVDRERRREEKRRQKLQKKKK